MRDAHPYLQQVLDRAASDADFRARLKSDPAVAIKEHTGIEVPEGFTIHFAEKPAGVDLMVVLPDPVVQATESEADELSLDELEAAAGGTGGYGGDYESPW